MKEDHHTYHDPPERIMRLLRWFCADSFHEEIEGDLYELFQEEIEAYGIEVARRRFFFTSLRYLNPYFFGKKDWFPNIHHHKAMLQHYLKISFRHLLKQRIYSLINIAGLAVAMTCCMAVLIFVKDENSFDKYHHNADRLYRLSLRSVMISTGDDSDYALSPILWAPALQEDYPEVEAYARFVSRSNRNNPWQIRFGDNVFFETDILYADPSALKLFNWPMLHGDPGSALEDPNAIVLTEKMAEKYFGDEEALGKRMTVDRRARNREGQLTGETVDFMVSGVLKDIPPHSHFTFDFLLSSTRLNEGLGIDINGEKDNKSWYWRGPIAHTYLLLRKDVEPGTLEAKFNDFQDRYLGDDTRSRGYYYAPFLQRIDQIYLEGDMAGQLQPVGNKNYIYLFSVIALFILIIACINFMNLATARAVTRAKEVGLRKVIGARRRQLVSQFLGESVIISILAFSLAVLLVWPTLRLFYDYLGKEMLFNYRQEMPFLSSLLLIGLLVGILAGSYPAFFLSRFQPAKVLKGYFSSGKSGVLLRKGLVVFQFVISGLLIIFTLTLFRQLNFMRSYDLGFDQEQVLVLPPNIGQPLASKYEPLREQLLSLPQVADVTMSSVVPGQGGGGDIYAAKGAAPTSGFGLGEAFVDYNFVDMFGIELIAGRNFSKDLGTDEATRNEDGRPLVVKAILNEEAVRNFGWNSPEEALGKEIVRDPNAKDWTAQVIGVMKDFHYQSLREPIGPVSLLLLPNYRFLSVKLHPGDIQGAVAAIEQQVSNLVPEESFSYSFLDEAFQDQYETEQLLGEVFSYISMLAIFIACLGLFGLAAFTVSRRTKEIGIRKTLGASTSGIVYLLSKNFAVLVLIAVLIAIPIAYYVTETGLEYFAYRIEWNISSYVLATVIALSIAVITVSYHTIRAALTNPVESLRTE